MTKNKRTNLKPRNLEKEIMRESMKKIKESIKFKEFDVNTVKKPWTLVLNGKPLSRNVIYIGDELPDFLLQNYKREIYTLTRRNGSIVDENIRQKIKKTVIKELLATGHKYESRARMVKDTTSMIKNVSVKIKHIPRKGWAIIIGKRKSNDVDKDTIKVRNYLEKKGIVIEDEAICPTYCIPKKEPELEE